MALVKQIENEKTAIAAEYIKIAGCEIRHNFANNSKLFIVKVDVYKDKQMRDSGKDAAFSLIVELAVDFSYAHADVRPALYQALKTLPQFENAADDI